MEARALRARRNPGNPLGPATRPGIPIAPKDPRFARTLWLHPGYELNPDYAALMTRLKSTYG
jgi:hypothetical protein